MNNVILIVGYVVIFSMLLWVSYTDIKRRIIDHLPLGALLLAILPVTYIQFGEIYWLQSLIALIIGFILFSINVIGAGDVKLIAVLMLGIQPYLVPKFLIYVSLAGGVLAIVGLIFFNKLVRKRGLPYGVAISCGFALQLVDFLYIY